MILLIQVLAFSQTEQLIFKIEDTKLLPKVEDLEQNGVKRKSADLGLNKTLEEFQASGLRQLFPDSKRSELLKYYIVEAAGCQELLHELKRKFSGRLNHATHYQEPKPLLLPNDYNYAISTGCDGLRNVGLSYLDLINAPEAWEITTGDSSVIIGMIDSHLFAEHEDLAGKIFRIYDRNLRSSFAVQPDHGTMVAGVLAANTNNGKGISSVGYNCRIAKTSTNKNDLLLMAKDGVKVINISQDWGAANEADSLLLAELTEYYKVTIVAAAGNTNCSQYTYPASYENVISVTSVGHEFARGTTCNGRQFDWKDCHKKYINIPENEYFTHAHNNKVDICAPGYNIVTTCHPATYVNGLKEPTGQTFTMVDGTSFASPIVAGVCALMLSINPAMTPTEIRSILQKTAVNIDTIPENKEFAGMLGAGRIDACEAVKLAGTVFLSGEIGSLAISAGFGIHLNDVTIDANSGISLKARKQVEFTSDFEIPSGSVLSVEIDPVAITN